MTLRRVRVTTAPPYEVVIGPGALAEVPEYLAGWPAESTAALTDATVAPLYGKALALPGERIFTVPSGEDSKSMRVLESALDFLVGLGLDRSSTLVALGGGVVGDLGGLTASLFMRGIALVQCPTTLLSQVDSSVGGKTAVNLAGGKNLAGTFHQPRAVFADTETLASLSDDELRSGLGEVVKTALIGDADLMELLEREADAVLARDGDVLAEIVERCVRVKAGVVARDEREGGERKKLNLGHTFAHGIEHAAGYGTVPHGVAVAVGLVLALDAGKGTGLLRDAELVERTAALLRRLGIASSLGELRERYGAALAYDALVQGMRHDKKGAAGIPRFVLVEGIGALRIDVELDPDLLRAVLGR